jgi:serine O-acetyltransferase
MEQLRFLLYSDLQRQFVLEGRSKIVPNLPRFVARLLHHRFLPLVIFRCARAALLSRVPILPKLLTYTNLVLFGIEIAPGCDIGPGLFLPHTTGTVIGAWRIGTNVTIFQGVTLGAKGADMHFDRSLRPEIGDNVLLGAGCKILGGITLADGVTVGANSVVLKSVEANETVVGIPARTLSRQSRGEVECHPC